MQNSQLKKIIKEGYAKIVKQKISCCSSNQSCCGTDITAEDISMRMGYRDEEINSVPEGANLGLGCGNPVALASLREGEVVLDLGSGAGFDCFLAAKTVGIKGKVIGVDMTPEMIEKARENVKKGGYENVEFLLGDIENLPVADNYIDVVISNCVINLAPDKNRVFKEIYRVLKPGGRFMISDIVLLDEIPEEVKNSIENYIGCVAGAILKDDYLNTIKNAGFQNIKIIDESKFTLLMNKADKFFSIVASIKVFGVKA